jgi:hypothetical protein
MFELRIIYPKFRKSTFNFKVKYKRAVNYRNVNSTEFESGCKEAIKIELTCCIIIQKFNVGILYHCYCYKVNFQFLTVGANFLNPPIAH